MYILSIDVGNKTFGYCIIEVKNIHKSDVKNGLVSTNAIEMKLLSFKSDNIVGDIQVKYGTLTARTLALKKYLNSITDELNSLKIDQTKLKIIIEEQKKISEINRITQAQIIYHFISSVENIISISPVHKNSIHFSDDLAYSKFLPKYKTLKTATKNHTIENFKYWLDINKIDYSASKKIISHVADAFMQFYAYFVLICQK
jgi:hypothetical protein